MSNPMTLREALRQHETELARRWLERTLESYSSEGARFMARQQDRFANPVGHALRTGIAAVLDRWLAGASATELALALEPMVRVRAVQELSAGQAVAFVLLLKEVAREALERAGGSRLAGEQWRELDAEVDRLLLVTVDVYAHCRAEISEIRVAEVKRRVSGLLRRVGWGDDGPPDAPPDADEGAPGRSSS